MFMNVSRPTIVAIFFLVLTCCSHTATAQTEFQSTNKTVHLIELYTSEGCYSCPPADRWLSSLINNKSVFKNFVPVAFHVDYWNYLGWKDKYSREEFSERQRRYSHLGQVSGVYTPGMFLSGFEWRAWRQLQQGEFNQRRLANTNEAGILTVRYESNGANFIFTANNGQKPSRAYIALLGVDIEAPIDAGENKGKTLRHDFVVLDLQQAALQPNADGRFIARLPAFDTDLQAPRYAIAAWVTDPSNTKPIQATGGWISKP